MSDTTDACPHCGKHLGARLITPTHVMAEQLASAERERDDLLGQNHRLAAKMHGVELALEAAVSVVATNKVLISELEAERDELRAENAEQSKLLAAIRDGLDDATYPDPDDGTRQWCAEHSVYLRGWAAALLMLPPEVMRKLQGDDDE